MAGARARDTPMAAISGLSLEVLMKRWVARIRQGEEV
jgi:hypothetical protein